MMKWIAALFASAATGAWAQAPQMTAADLRFDPQALPYAAQAMQLWHGMRRSSAYGDAAMSLVAPGVSLNARNHAQYGAKIQPMMAAIARRAEAANADQSEYAADFTRRAGTLLTASEWQTLLDGLRPAGAATQSAIDATLATGLLSNTGIEARTSPEAARLWGRLRATPSADQPWGARAAPSLALLAQVDKATQAPLQKLQAALRDYVERQTQRTRETALAIGRELYPDYASGKARQVGSAAKIEAFIDAVRMPEVARFYATLWGDIRLSEAVLRVHELARAMGLPQDWDADGSRRSRMMATLSPRLDKLAMDMPTSEALADQLSGFLADADIDWMHAEWNSERGKKLMPTVERLIIASFWRHGMDSGRVWTGSQTYASSEIAGQARNALQNDPNRRDALILRLAPIEKTSPPAIERVLRHQVERTRAALDQVFRRDDKELRAYLKSLN
jgi:hypothetical protein